MKTLQQILTNVTPLEIRGDAAIAVAGLYIDSRQVTPGSLFIAIKGFASDGHMFIGKAIENGANAVLCETLPEQIVAGVTYVHVKDSAVAAGLVAASFYDNPSLKLKVVGVTGTNGKTTTATLLYQLFEKMGHKCGLLSTVQNHIHNEVVIATHTTPDAISIQALLRKMVDAGCEFAFMEVSSHAIHQHRISGIRFVGGIFTNITHDHLDYHKTFDEYITVKKRFFDGLPAAAFALTNADDRRGAVMLQNTAAQKYSYSLREPASYKGKVLENGLVGLYMLINGIDAHFRMIGTFNAYNLLAVYGTALLLGADKMNVLAVLSDLHGAPGRFETYMSPTDKTLGIVDYAHTPDALLNVLATINQLRTNGQRLITVVGCGGDREKTKRPVMAEVACTHSDKTILTSDNPRSENPEDILNDMEQGLGAAQKRKCLRITDRKEAIKVACSLANPGDIILVAGKGHETYQEIKGVKYHFDDREILTEAFKTLDN